MNLIELSDYRIASTRPEGLAWEHLALCVGDVCAVKAASPVDAALFLRALTTLVSPKSGVYRFDGQTLDFSDYRKLLLYKKRIGYITAESNMISNRSIRENLLLMRNYHENSLTLSLDERTEDLCRRFDIHDKLDLRPGQLRPFELRYAVAVRELTKASDLMLLDRPEDFIGQDKLDLFSEILKSDIIPGQVVVFFSLDRYFVKTHANCEIRIDEGAVRTRLTDPKTS